jgi:hypothetical protein
VFLKQLRVVFWDELSGEMNGVVEFGIGERHQLRLLFSGYTFPRFY